MTRIGRLSPGGNKYLKALMVTAAFHRMIRRKPGVDPWVDDLVERKKPLVAAVCIANKLGRVMWSMAYHGTTYDPAKWCGGAVRGN